MKVLIVDDSSVMRRIVERSLRQAGLPIDETFEAGHGLEAIEVLKQHRVDLILSDISMPQMDGLQFVEHVAREGLAPNVPIVMITTEGGESHVMRAITSGAKGYIRKPFTPEQVAEHVLPLVAVQS